jgi:hypothetical protein
VLQNVKSVMLELFPMPLPHPVQHVPVDIIPVPVQVSVLVAWLVNSQTEVLQNVISVQQEPFLTQRPLLVHHVQMACIHILEVQDVLVVLMPTTDGYRALVSLMLVLAPLFGPKFNSYVIVMQSQA